MMLWDIVCDHPAGSYKPGDCRGVLIRVSSTGGVEAKCHRCYRVTMIHRSEIEQYRVEPVAPT